MKNNDIVKSNKLIADFMGYKTYGQLEALAPEDEYMKDWYYISEKIKGYETWMGKPESLPYQTSWDWLMPVWRKVSTEICLWMCCHEKAYYGKLWNEKGGEIQSFIMAVDIKTAYNKICQLIQWYNSQKP